MLDVHPPHQAAHSWKDFLIHIATIVVGLLIAIGLEQTVEYFHHRHQLHQLHEDLHAETLRNLHLALANVDDCESRRDIARSVYREVIMANRDHRAPVLNTNLGRSSYMKPASAVWTVAQQSGTLGLLPREEAQRYVRVYSLVDQVNAVLVLQNAAFIKLREALEPGRTVLTPEQLKLGPVNEYSAAWAALDSEDFREARNALAQMNEAGMAKLARHVAYRRSASSVRTASRPSRPASRAQEARHRASRVAPRSERVPLVATPTARDVSERTAYASARDRGGSGGRW